jgi:hypothetical protein
MALQIVSPIQILTIVLISYSINKLLNEALNFGILQQPFICHSIFIQQIFIETLQ